MASCFCSICKFGSLKNTFATITSQSELHFRFRRFILLVQTKKMISMNYGSSRNCWKPWTWVRFGLILTMRGIYINSCLNSLTIFASTSKSTEFKDNPPNGTSLKRLGRPSVIKQGILFWVYWKVNGNQDNMIGISQWRESPCRTNTCVRRQK